MGLFILFPILYNKIRSKKKIMSDNFNEATNVETKQEETKGIWNLVIERIKYAKKCAIQDATNLLPSEQITDTVTNIINELMGEVETNFNLLKEQVTWLQQFAQRNIVIIEDGSVSDAVLENFDLYQIPYLIYRKGATAPQILRLKEVDVCKDKNI